MDSDVEGDLPRFAFSGRGAVRRVDRSSQEAAMYEVLRQIKAGVGGGIIKLGERHVCRFCGNTDPRRFRQRAHTFPEALGNHWVISRDECDDCNAKFSKYEDALVKAVGIILTVGGEKGKGHSSRRQTGRTGSASTVRHLRDADGNRRISTRLRGDGSSVRLAWQRDVLTIRHSVAPEKFVPRYAYKALTKMAYALLPDEELANYGQTRTWLLDVNDSEDFPVLEVALSFTLLGNAPPLAVGTLLRRSDPLAPIPHILFLLSIGSLCFQIDLRSDHLEDHLPPIPIGQTVEGWRIGCATNSGPQPEPYVLTYSKPSILNWSSKTPRLQPVEELLFHKCMRTTAAEFELVMRDEPWLEDSGDDADVPG
ncbi:MAG: HNH endonuclease [Kofleriaceae bacterium]|nr:MAG: HNH endonuclease [Kofleriaceae bacterium]